MDSKELLAKSTHKFDRTDLEKILEDLYVSSDKDSSKLETIISQGKSAVTPVDEQATKHLLFSIIPHSIIKYDIKHAMELAQIDDEELFNIKVVRDETNEPGAIKKFKNSIFNGSGNNDGIYYEGKEGKQYLILSSNELFPNSRVYKENDNIKHEFIINSTGKNYIDVITELYESFLRDSIPFHTVMRYPSDMSYGFPDAIKLYCTDRNLQATLDELVSVLSMNKDKVENPDWRLCASIDGLFGYIQIDPKNGSKTTIDNMFKIITKVIDQELTDYDLNHGREAVQEYNWTNRSNKLLKMKAMDNDAYENLLDNIMKYLKESNINLNDIFKTPKELTPEEKLLKTVDSTIDRLTALEKAAKKEEDLDKTNIVPIVNPEPIVTVVKEEKEPSIFDDEEYIKAYESWMKSADSIAAEFNELKNKQIKYAEEHRVEEKKEDIIETKEDIPEEPIVEPIIPSVQIEEPESFDYNEEIKNIADEVDKDEEEFERDRLDETQAYVPVTEEMILGFNANKKSNPPVLPDDVEEVDPSKEIDDEEFVSLDTGSYQAIPVEVTNFDGEEVKSIVDAPQAGQNINASEVKVALDEYEGIISPNEALSDVINSNGERVSLIDYLHNEKVSSKVPFDSMVVLNDGSEVTGREFTKNFIVPIIKQSSFDQIYTVDQVINNYSTSIRFEGAKKKGGFFSKLFGRK